MDITEKEIVNRIIKNNYDRSCDFILPIINEVFDKLNNMEEDQTGLCMIAVRTGKDIKVSSYTSWQTHSVLSPIDSHLLNLEIKKICEKNILGLE